ncbi:hypothetical protein [Natronorubrum halophilum]|uniref:hypothetical protein n=1 Tax=Natronorubrum halophilum TaxID=1702106 RepID=UPI0013CF26BF|nr:hypothetical protein [Natronorubrum halophilum]
MSLDPQSNSERSLFGSLVGESVTRPQYLTAGLAFVVELLYLWVAAEALLFWPVHGAFFAALAIGQGLLAVNLLFDPGRWTFRLGVLFNAGLLVFWVIARVIETIFPVWIIAVRTPVDSLEYIVMVLVLSLLLSLIWMRKNSN